ncbi:NUDIX domain-containing protein [Paenibacillus puldeungensis]|uniref:NUDIX domain-containing protein n=1 Tax=Paenibacillus puldeungensis TaxID=696536 RepID=A0ABW3S0Z9_9BACL
MSSIIDKIAWIHVVNHQVLVARSKGKDNYYFPGGKREAGETDAETLVREAEEEVSVRIKPETMVHFGTFSAQADGKPEGILVQMTCYLADYEGELAPASEIAELAWFSYKDCQRTSVVSRIIFDRLREHGLLK